mgnify:FL=1
MLTALILSSCFATAQVDPIPVGSEAGVDDAPRVTIANFSAKSIDGKEVSLAQYMGKVVLVVNTASKCGLTPQYKKLQEMYEKYEKKGFVVLGFPSNDFQQQEPGTNSEIKEFCTKNYGVTFPMFEKISVNGQKRTKLYQWMINSTSNRKPIQWNFEKFLINKGGFVVARFDPRTAPDDPTILQLIHSMLGIKVGVR